MRLWFILFFAFASVLARAQTPVWTMFPNTPPSPATGPRNDDIYFVDQQHGWSARGTDGVYRTTNGGITWTKSITNGVTIPLTAHFRSIGFATTNHGWAGNLGPGSYDGAVTDTNLLYETFNGGDTWGVVTQLNYTTGPGIPPMLGFCAMHIFDTQHIFGVGRVRGPAYFVKSEDSGATWYVTNLTAGGVMGGLMDVYFKDLTNGFIVGMNTNSFFSPPYYGSIARTTNGGLSWQVLVTTTISNCYFWKMSWPTPQVGYVSLQQNNNSSIVVFYKTTDGGATWVSNGIPASNFGSPGIFEIQGVGFVSTNEGWMGGTITLSDPYTFIHTTNGGVDWKAEGYPNTQALNRFRFVSPTLGYMSGRALHVYHIPLAVSISPPVTNIPFGSNMTFGVTAYGTQPMRYQWLFNGTNLPGATTNSYSIVGARARDIGSYALVVSDFTGSITSAPSSVTVAGLPVPPSITTPPLDQVVTLGSNATFTVAASGTAPLSYQWYFDNAALAGATNTSYTRTNVQQATLGNYSVVVTNLGGAASAVAVLAFGFADNFDQYVTPVTVTNPATTNGYKIFYGADGGPVDFKAVFGFDYSTVTFPTSIPSAPHSSGGSTKGLFITVNKDLNDFAAAVNLYPVSQIFSNNYSLKFDLWLDWMTTGSATEHALFGLNQSGNITNRPTEPTSDGLFFAVDGDGNVAGTTSSIRDFAVFCGGGAGATPFLMTTNNTVFGPTPPLGGNFDNFDPGISALFPSKTLPTFTTAVGSPGFGWVSVEVRQENNLITCLMNGVAIAQYTNTYGYTNGTVFIGYNDFFPTHGSTNNYAIFDNVRVQNIIYSPVQVVSSQMAGTNFNFNFGTERYESYTVQYTTNLTTGIWQAYTNFMGDGATDNVIIPVPAGSADVYFRVSRP